MISELTIKNLAIIEQSTLTLDHGFNVLTGETGAGKSIILDAMMMVLGDRPDTGMIRSGCEMASAEAVFHLDDHLQTTVNPILVEQAIENEVPDELILTRIVKATGRTTCKINGNVVSSRLLKQVGAFLVDIHGQGAHLGLLQSRSHLPLLDRYAGIEKEREQFTERVNVLRTLQAELSSLQQDERVKAQRIDMLTFQIEEIREAGLKEGEEVDLIQERTRLANAESLTLNATAVTALIIGVDDDDTPSTVDLLGQAERALATLARLDESKEDLLAQLQGVTSELNDVAAEVQSYQDSLEFNPARLNEIEGRLEQIATLKRKYGDSVDEILAFFTQAEQELATIQHSDERKGELDVEINKLLREVGVRGEALSKKRQKASETLKTSIETELGDLKMKAQFAVDFQTSDDPNGAYVGDQRLKFDKTGIDKLEFLLSANPGEPPRPLAKVASGGETARIMLALKTALAQVDETPTLIFDEIDQGIGGRIGDVVGQKLWRLAAEGNHQVIVVTHLPQLAGYGDRHFHIRKQVVDGRTSSEATVLDYQTRVHELAEMLGTDDQHAVGGAAAILENVKQTKEKQRKPKPKQTYSRKKML